MSDPGLFEVPADAYLLPPEPENLTPTERFHRRIAARIATGIHPLGKDIRLHADAARERGGTGLTCGGCRFRENLRHHNKSYPKCRMPLRVGERTWYPRDTHSDSSDVRAWWPACKDFQLNED